MLQIGEFSYLTKISIRSLRHYDEIGLLKPYYIDNFTNYRYYHKEQLTLAGQIQALKTLGISLEEIKDILAKDKDTAENHLYEMKAKKEKEMAALSQQILMIENTLAFLRDDGIFEDYSIILKEIPQRNVVSLRDKIPYYDNEGLLWERLYAGCRELDIKLSPVQYNMAVFHDKCYMEKDVDVEIQASAEVGNHQNYNGLIFKTEPVILAAALTYQGDYNKITAVNKNLTEWIRDNGFILDNKPYFNIYHTSPQSTSHSRHFVTEVCFPVKSNTNSTI